MLKVIIDSNPETLVLGLKRNLFKNGQEFCIYPLMDFFYNRAQMLIGSNSEYEMENYWKNLVKYL